jgi:hypothetical protein
MQLGRTEFSKNAVMPFVLQHSYKVESEVMKHPGYVEDQKSFFEGQKNDPLYAYPCYPSSKNTASNDWTDSGSACVGNEWIIDGCEDW